MARDRLVLAVDIGSSSLRVGLGAPGCALVAIERREHTYEDVAHHGELARELSVSATLDSLSDATRAVLRSSNVVPAQLAAVAVSAQRYSVVLLDAEHRVISASPNTDMRAVFHGAAIDEEAADEVWATTGRLPSFMQVWSRLRWYREEEPAVFERIRHVCTLSDWICYELCGELALENAGGVESGLIDVRTGEVAESLARRTGFSPAVLPPAIASGSVVGRTTRRAAERFGLSEGVPVVAAGPDSQTALVALGMADEGETGIVAGWSCTLMQIAARVELDPNRAALTGRHVLPHRWVWEGNAGIMGGAYEWAASLLHGDGTASHALDGLNRLAEAGPAGADGVTAHLGPGALDLAKPGMSTGGFLFPVPFALNAPSPAQLARAAVENFAFAVRLSAEHIARASHAPESSIAVGGGMTRSRAFLQILANVMGRNMLVGTPHDTLRGAIAVAACAIDRDSDLTASTRARRCELDTISPDADAVSRYSDLFEIWQARNTALLDSLL